jgi:hypothetical protein
MLVGQRNIRVIKVNSLSATKTLLHSRPFEDSRMIYDWSAEFQMSGFFSPGWLWFGLLGGRGQEDGLRDP